MRIFNTHNVTKHKCLQLADTQYSQDNKENRIEPPMILGVQKNITEPSVSHSFVADRCNRTENTILTLQSQNNSQPSQRLQKLKPRSLNRQELLVQTNL